MEKQKKVYSPDVVPYSFEGESYLLGTFMSIVVAPIRIVSRVLHNIVILPGDMQLGYSNSLLIVSSILMVIGLLDAMLVGKWPLFISQIPVLLYAMYLKKQATLSSRKKSVKRDIEINTEVVEEMCNSIYDDINNVLRSDSNG